MFYFAEKKRNPMESTEAVCKKLSKKIQQTSNDFLSYYMPNVYAAIF